MPTPREGELWLVNANIPEYLQASRFNQAPKQPRRLLLHRRQINRLAAGVEREGFTIVPLKLYFNEKGRAKLELALALHDKRETESAAIGIASADGYCARGDDCPEVCRGPLRSWARLPVQ
jgi:tmRNA-binding protein